MSPTLTRLLNRLARLFRPRCRTTWSTAARFGVASAIHQTTKRK